MMVGMKMNEIYKGKMRNNLWKTRYGTFLFVILLVLAKITYKFKRCY